MKVKENLKFKVEFKFKNKTLFLNEGITSATYDARLNIITLSGVLNENNFKMINEIQDIADRTAKNIMSDNIKFKFKLIEEGKNQASLDIMDCRVILYNEIYDIRCGVTILSIAIRGYSASKMPAKKFTLLKGWNYLMSTLSVIGGASIVIGGELMALPVITTPVSGWMVVTGVTLMAKNGSDLSGYIRDDFFMPLGMGYGDEGDFIKRGFEDGFGEKGEQYYEGFVLGFTVLTLYCDYKSLKNIAKYKEGEIIFEGGVKKADLKKIKPVDNAKEISDELKAIPTHSGKFRDKTRGGKLIYGVQSRSLDYLGSIKNMNFYGWRDAVILGNDLNGARMFIAQTYLDK